MAVYLSPGVYLNEIDLSVLPTAVGALTPAFFGAANKGPMNKPTLILSAADYVDTFGNPFPESYLGYAVMAYLSEGNRCWVTRVGVECSAGQPQELQDVCIDTSGEQGVGWGRIPLFQGIDYGRINFRPIDDAHPLVFQAASTGTVLYHEALTSVTSGPTQADLTITGTYTGSLNDNFTLLVTGSPAGTSGSPIDGATFQVMRGSDGAILAAGTMTDAGGGTSNPIVLPNGLTLTVDVTSGALGVNDVFTWTVAPDNRKFTVAVEGIPGASYTMPVATYTDVPTFVAALNALIITEGYIAVTVVLPDDVTVVPQLQTQQAGQWLQLMGTAAFATAVGQVQYIYDIPRAYLMGSDAPPLGYTISSANNRVIINVIDNIETQQVTFVLPSGVNMAPAQVAANINGAGGLLFNSMVVTAPGGGQRILIITTQAQDMSYLQMLANYTHLATLRFAEMIGIPYPYQRGYRGYQDTRPLLPPGSATDPGTPASCEGVSDPQCTVDVAYYANIVGWLVATSPGTWIDNVTASLSLFTQGIGEVAGRYALVVKDRNSLVVSQIQDFSFDIKDDRYIGNVINPGSKYGGRNGDPFFNWIPRPAYLNFDPTQGDTSQNPYQVRQPAVFAGLTAAGGTNGIPTDPAFSSELDAAVMGNPVLSTGIFAMQNPESYDIDLLITPGFSSGAVIANCLQMCEARGDVLYLVDPPFGLRPQQVVDWHNGMLVSDLNAAINTSYGALYWSWVQVFDQFNNIQIWVPPSGHVSSVFSRTERLAAQWFAPAGLNRGKLLTALAVEYSPSQAERDLLYGYGNAVNPIVSFPKDGIVIWGQRTLQRQASALDRVNVRMLLIYLKKNLSVLLRTFLFEPNDKTLWAQVESTLNPFMANIQAQRGLTGYRVVCDATNNTPDRIDRNELWVSVFIQPTRAVEFVVLNLVVIQTGASFSAAEVLAAGGIVTSGT